MSKQQDGWPACAWCDKPSHIRQGRIVLCATHYRISSMRARAKRDGKHVPTRKQLERLIPSPFVCIGCCRPMNWLRSEGTSTQATLQHDRSGQVRIICLGCNTRHAQHPGDSFYEVPQGHKRCPDCEQVLPRGQFNTDRSRPIGLKSYCRQCSRFRDKKRRERNAAAA